MSQSRIVPSLPPDTIRLELTGSAGQGFGVFLTAGIALSLTGEANDSVGKSMSGGSIVIRPPADVGYEPAENAIVGNCALYGATGGRLFAYGRAGDRFAVRNSGATAVVEGAGMHACEYMTLGRVLILGATDANLGAGMTGGEVFVRRDQTSNLNREYIEPHELADADVETLRRLLADHTAATGSDIASTLLSGDDASLRTAFVVCRPIAAAAPTAGPTRAEAAEPR